MESLQDHSHVQAINPKPDQSEDLLKSSDIANVEANDNKDITDVEKVTEQLKELSAGEDLSSSVATLRPQSKGKERARPVDITPPLPPPKDQSYLDPTPRTPLLSQNSSRSPSEHGAETLSGDESLGPTLQPIQTVKLEDRKRKDGNISETDDESKSEIHTIMTQFEEGGPGEAEVMSPRLEITGPFFSSPQQHPPRSSSLEPAESSESGLGLSQISPNTAQAPTAEIVSTEQNLPAPPTPGFAVIHGSPLPAQTNSEQNVPPTPTSPILLHKPQPPVPDPEPDLPFDFHRFLEQLRHRSADPVARYLRSFLSEFSKKQWMVHEQVKIISDFLSFITNKMARCDVWRGVSDAEFDNAREGMEKLVMNRLYSQTFSPAIPPPAPIPSTTRRKRNAEKQPLPGRRGQHQEDVERDEILAQKIRIYSWVREQHLDIKPVGESGRKFLSLAQQELLKIKTYRAPRDKVICVLNSCKVIFGLLRHSKSDMSADAFMPLLIYVVLQANPEHLVSNVQYILRFRNSEKLGGEAGYYLSSLMGAVQFIESMDRSSLTITDEEFEQNVEAAVAAIAEKHEQEIPTEPELSEKVGPSGASARSSALSDGSGNPRKSVSSQEETSNEKGNRTNTDGNDDRPVAGLLRTFQNPLSSIGRIFGDDQNSRSVASPASATSPTQPGSAVDNTLNSAVSNQSSLFDDPAQLSQAVEAAQKKERSRLSAQDAAARQASAESAEAQRIQSAEHANVVKSVDLHLLFYNYFESAMLITDLQSTRRHVS
jgi:hypothetical protein